jgi:DNA-binding IclR family transcriptional regulator
MRTEKIRGRGVDRLLDVFDEMERGDQPMTVLDLARRLGAPKSTIYLLVDLLVEREYLEPLTNGRYQLGPRFGRLGLAYGRHASFAIIARKALVELANRTKVIAELVVVDNWIQFVPLAAVAESNPYLRSSEGARFPLPHTASARFLLRDVPREAILQNIPAAHYDLPNGEHTSCEQFIADIEAARHRETYSTRGLVDPHLSCIAVPLLDPDGNCIAALSLVMPLTELDFREGELSVMLLETAQSLTSQLKVVPFKLG